MNRHAFTLVELLMVLVVIAIIAGIMIGSLGVVIERSRRFTTIQRIDAVHSALVRLGKEHGSLARVIQRDVDGVPGTLLFERQASNDYVTPADSATWHAVYPDSDAVAPGNSVVTHVDTGAPLVMAYPWGADREYYIREDWYIQAFDPDLAVTDPDTWSDQELARWVAPELHRIHELWPRHTAEILVLAGVVNEVDDYRENRHPGREWNDAWGQPLVIAYALYQPPRYTPETVDAWAGGTTYAAGNMVESGSDRYTCIANHESASTDEPGSDANWEQYWRQNLRNPDYYLREALRRYQYNRALYIAVGAPGEGLDPVRFDLQRIPSGLDDATWEEVLTGLWEQICEVTMPSSADEWTESSFERPPWEGVTRQQTTKQGVDLQCFLSAPVEYR